MSVECVRMCVDVEVHLHHKTITHVRYLQQLHNVSRRHIAIDGNDLKAAHITKKYPCNKATRSWHHLEGEVTTGSYSNQPLH